MIIAIDGPAGAGKTSVSKGVAASLDFVRLDTGAMYRAVALAAKEAGVSPDDASLEQFVMALPMRYETAGVYLDDRCVEAYIRTPEVSRLASIYSASVGVRRGLLSLQRMIGRQQNSVVDGRDIGTVVFPDAELKVFLTASVEERARRRWRELALAGQTAELSEIRAEIAARDHADMTRDVAPLKQAVDAILIDSTNLDITEVIETIVGLAKERA
ncbi:MAG: (d)CMP kinase [Bradymonadia bacterium]